MSGISKCWVAVAGLALLGACETSGGSATAPTEASATIESIETTALVKLVDLEERQVLLEDRNGRLVTIIAGPEVRNLDQVEPGDTVEVAYVRSIAVHMVQPGEATADVQAVVADVRSPEGERPATIKGESVTMLVQIVSYDPDSKVVVFTAPDGFTHSVVVQRPEMQEFALGLSPGDEVEVTFTEALAAAVVETTQ